MKLSGKSVLCLVSGASRGFGRCLAQKFRNLCVEQETQSLHLIIHGRPSSTAVLDKFKTELTSSNSGRLALTVHTVGAELGDADPSSIDPITSALTTAIDAAQPTVAVLFNNAGVCAPKDLAYSLAVNTVGATRVTEAFLAAVADISSRYVILISSKAAIVAVAGITAYCSSKAATDMWHWCLAKEQPELRVLRYGPGPLDTDMTRAQVNKDAVTASIRGSGRMFLDPAVPAEKLMVVLATDQFENGMHLDYYEQY